MAIKSMVITVNTMVKMFYLKKVLVHLIVEILYKLTVTIDLTTVHAPL